MHKSYLRRYGKYLAAGAAAVAALVAASVVRTGNTANRIHDQLESGAAYADSIEAVLPRDGPADSSAVLAALYLERLRLGLGSPLRLVEYAIRDHRLPAAARRRVALGILARTAAGRAYTSAPEALAFLSPDGRSLGAQHGAFIESVTQSSDDPRSAELALRLAYQVSTASGVVSHRAWGIAVSAIAQARDRALAMRDVRELLDVARRDRIDPVDLVPTWRAARRFDVERPLREPPSGAQERAAATLLPKLVGQLARLEAIPLTVRRDSEPDLGASAAATATRLAAAREAPPQAPVVVTLSGFSSYVVGGARSAASRSSRTAFLARSRNEETLAAEYLALRSKEPVPSEAAIAVLTAAVALRPYAQERAWHPGDEGPAPVELQTRLGLASLSFDAKVPTSWRGYYARMLEVAVRDLRLVFPELDLGGLHVRFGESPLRDRALALHDPATRTVYLPLATSAGAIAHELSHDLDWQAARRKYGTTTSYRTDRSVRQYRDGLAPTLERLSAAAAREFPGSLSGNRPTEAFARGVDWIVAATLARRGVLNGYLTGVQDAHITGYASANAPRRDATMGDPTIVALGEITTMSAELRRWYQSEYGDEKTVGIAEGVRRVLGAPSPRWENRAPLGRSLSPWASSAQLLTSASSGANGWACLLDAPSLRATDGDALREVMQVAAESRVAGVLRRWREYAISTPGSQMRSLSGAPWNPATTDSLAREYRDAMLWRAARVEDGRQGSDLTERAERRAVLESCARGA